MNNHTQWHRFSRADCEALVADKDTALEIWTHGLPPGTAPATDVGFDVAIATDSLTGETALRLHGNVRFLTPEADPDHG